jgi:probable HAF family extracellular repeat protein
MTRFNLSMAILACSLTTSSVAAPGDVHYRVTQIAGGTPVQAGDINDRGEVVGSVGDFFDSRAFLWDGRFIDLGPRIDPAAARAFASGNNNRSDIVGAFTDAAGVNRGFLLRRGVERVPVEVFPGASIGIADINNRRQVIGVTTDASGQERGFVWQRGEAMLFDPLPVHQGRRG